MDDLNMTAEHIYDIRENIAEYMNDGMNAREITERYKRTPRAHLIQVIIDLIQNPITQEEPDTPGSIIHPSDTTIIKEYTLRRNNSRVYGSYLKVRGCTLRVQIEINIADHLSGGQVFKWNGNTWGLIYEAPISTLNCRVFNYDAENIDIKEFKKDAQDLIRITWGILF